MSLGIRLVFSFADYLQEISETGVQHSSSLSCWKYILVWDLLQFTIGGQSLRRIDWLESCEEEQQ